MGEEIDYRSTHQRLEAPSGLLCLYPQGPDAEVSAFLFALKGKRQGAQSQPDTKLDVLWMIQLKYLIAICCSKAMSIENLWYTTQWLCGFEAFCWLNHEIHCLTLLLDHWCWYILLPIWYNYEGYWTASTLEYTNLIVDLNQRHFCWLNHWIHCLIPLLDHVVIYSNIYDITMEVIYWILPCGSYLNLDQIWIFGLWQYCAIHLGPVCWTK